jgi:hypothetical protein
MERHKAIIRIMKAWAWRVGPGYAVPLTDALADHVIEFVIQNNLLGSFDAPDDPEALKRRAVERAAKRCQGANQSLRAEGNRDRRPRPSPWEGFGELR